MNTSSQVQTAVEELLAPIEQALQACAAEPHLVSDASRQLRQAAEALEDAANDDWRLCAHTMTNLLEIVDCFAEGADALTAETTQDMLEFVQSALPSLRVALTGSAGGEDGRSPLELVEQARSRWGDYLTLVDGDAFHESPVLDQGLAETNGHFPECGAPAASPLDQVELILSAMNEHPERNGDDQHARAHRSESGSFPSASESPASTRGQSADARPRVPAAPQRISISDTLLEAYLEDADLCLSSMERSVIAIENDADRDASVKQLCRDLHTLKGASASIGLSELATYLHEIEEWLQAEEPAFEPGQLQPILDCVDFVRLQIETLQHPEGSPSQDRPSGNHPPEPHSSQTPLPPVPTGGDRTAEPGEETIRVRSSQLDRMMNLLVDLVIWRRQRDRRVVEMGDGGDELSRCVLRLERFAKQYPLHRPFSAHESAQGRASINSVPRESSSHLGELVSDLREIAGSFRECRQSLADENRAVSQFIQQFRQQLTQVRRVPLAGLFQRLQRVVRDAARLEDKQVRLEWTGQNTGLERSLQERLFEPLLHLVRNAVCHGIEPSEHRRQAGKDPVGTITLEASGSSQMLLLEIRDDGGGLDYDAIRRRGIERGLLRPDEPVSPNELSRLIFHPGFTTRTEASEMAGRGVGMDVVLTALNRCHCQIDVQSVPGAGTSFRLAIPLPSVIEHFLVFRSGGRLFGLPMQFVMSTSQEETHSAGREGSGSHHRLDLRRILQLEGCGTSEALRSLVLGANLSSPVASADNSRLTSPRHTLEQRREYLVEEILGPEEVVVRPLPSLLRHHPLLVGVTLSGAGEVMLLLDGPRLLRAAASHAESGVSPGTRNDCDSAPPKSRASRGRILIADDSLSARRRLVEKLAPRGFEITEASDGLEALNCMHSASFDAVFSDLEMPGLDGFELLTECKNHSRSRAKPVIIVTSRNEAATRARAGELGADGFLAKPVSDSDIETLLQQPVFHRSTTGAKE